MKVLHIVGGDLTGGAARGALWLHKALRSLGIDSKILTNSKITFNDKSIITTLSNKKEKIMDIFRRQMDMLPTKIYKNRKNVVFSTGIVGFDFTKTDIYKDADIVHLHWICGGFVNIKHLTRVDKPIIWTMRDMWPMTGGCHYALDCENYQHGCGHCKQLNSRSLSDLSRWILKRKIKSIPKNIKIVGISSWLSERAKESAIFKEFDIRTIYNNVNTEEFFPIDKKVARTILGIKPDKKVILTAAHSLNEVYKGFDKFIDAVKRLSRDKYLLIFFGMFDEQVIKDLCFEYKILGFLYDSVSLRVVYSAADVFVASSIAEAFGKTLAESMACGTPVVCFDATGPKEIVEHKISGYKAKPFDASDLAYGIEWILNNSNYEELSERSREKVLREFDSKIVAKRYIELYKEILS